MAASSRRQAAGRKVALLTIQQLSSAPIAIGVPVRNEVARLPRLLTALNNQTTSRPFTLCIFFDNCDDGSEQLVAQWSPHLRYRIVVRSMHAEAAANAGAARRRAMALALACASDEALLTTDADSEPARDWIDTNMAALDRCDVVAGRIVSAGSKTPDLHHRLAAYLDRLHALRRTIDPADWEAAVSHHWTSAASLACRSQVYRHLGGFHPMPNGEDADFADRAARAGYRLRRDADVTVRTSSRRKGRAQHGFAATLAALDLAVNMPEVAHPEDEAWRFRMQAEARAAFEAGHPRSVAAGLNLPIAEVDQVASECVNHEAFAARIVGAPPGGMRMVSLAHAEALLAGLDLMTMAGAA